MGKLFGTLRPNESKTDGDKRPDWRGSIKVGANQGRNSSERDEENARFLVNVSKDFKDNDDGTWVAMAMWERRNDDGDVWYSIILEDNEWKKNSPGKARKGNAKLKASEDVPF